jgi:predicted phosphohydrolase
METWKNQEIISRKACYLYGREDHYLRNCPEKSSLPNTSKIKLSHTPDMEYEQKCTKTSINIVKNNKRNRKMFGHMSSPPQPQAKAPKHMDTCRVPKLGVPPTLLIMAGKHLQSKP